MVEFKGIKSNMSDIIGSDTNYVEEMLSSILRLEPDSIQQLKTFLEIGLHSRGKGLIITLCDGKRYYMPITIIPSMVKSMKGSVHK